MKNDKLKQFVSLREQLLRDKADLEARLSEINKALGAVGSAVVPSVVAAPVAKRGSKPSAPKAGAKPASRKRAQNSISLREAVLEATKSKPLSRQEILAAVQSAGYVFTAKDPLNSLSTLLYTDKGIKNHGGKFGPA